MRFLKLSILFAAVFFSTSVSAQTLRSLQGELNVVKEEVEAMRRSQLRSGTSSINDASDVQVRINEMDETFRKTSGKIEELEFKIKSLEDRMEVMNRDFDIRFKMLESGSAATPSQQSSSTNSQPVNTVQQLGSANSDNIDVLYQKGLDAVKAKDNQTAINSFTKILSDNPNHKLAGNAQYWLGETYYAQKDFQMAAISFAKGYEKYKTGPKGADSLLKLGMSMVELKKKNEACIAFTSLPKEFPKADASLKSKASELAKKNSCK